MNSHKTMSFHYLLRGIILFSFAVFIVMLVRSDQLLYYIAPKMMIYVKLSAMALYAISAYQLYLAAKSWKGRVEGCDCDHMPSSSIFKNIIVYGLFIFPLLLGFMLPNAVMGSALASKKGINLNSSSSIRTDASIQNITPLADIADVDSDLSGTKAGSGGSETTDKELEKLFEYDAFTEFYAKFGMKLYQKEVIPIKEEIYIETLTTLDLFLDTFVGKKVEVSGFIYRDKGMNPDQFVVARFAIQCCSADGAPYGVFSDYDGAHKFADDEWVTVTGTVAKTTFNENEIMSLKVEKIERIEEPASPYVYPNYDFQEEDFDTIFETEDKYY